MQKSKCKIKEISRAVVVICFLFLCFNSNISATDLEISIEAKREETGVVFYGKTNLPDGAKLGIEARTKNYFAQDFNIFVRDGQFTSAQFSNRDVPLTGDLKIKLFTYFTPTWQNSEVLKELAVYSSPYIKKSDPDLVDSDKILEIEKNITISPPSEELQAIKIVMKYYIVNEGFGRSEKPIGECVKQCTQEATKFSGTWVKFSGWRAESETDYPKVYNVFFEYEYGKSGVGSDPGTKQKAWFQCNIENKTVICKNKNASNIGWLPNY